MVKRLLTGFEVLAARSVVRSTASYWPRASRS
jgi:hypothetical protein